MTEFAIDAIASAVVMPAYLSGSLWIQLTVLAGLILAGAWSLRALPAQQSQAES
jgi:hypothetical protein